MLFTDIIRTKRDGHPLDKSQIEAVVAGLADGSVPAEQISALAMAVCLNGMNSDEAAELTLGMSRSGVVLDWTDEDLDGPVVDKHSTGGVGDKVSFLLAPIVAACGGYVPMISGRGLGHTGGTTDKVEAIPGYVSMPDFDRFRQVVKSVGCAVIGQTNDLAPADKRFYAIRDVTSTVESVPLITASILSKKIAAGLQGLVMDVKVGSGAFMETEERGRKLADSIIATAARAGLPTHAILTDMNEVLGDTAGNALEIVESIRYLKNEHRESRLDEVTQKLCAQMLLVSEIETDSARAFARVEEAIVSGRAADKFAEMVSALGGPVDFVERYDSYLPTAPITRAIHAEAPGFLVGADTRLVGNAIIELGGGRHVLGEALDLSVGFSEVANVGTKVDKERPLAMMHAANEEQANAAEAVFRSACKLGDSAPGPRPAIIDTITAASVA